MLVNAFIQEVNDAVRGTDDNAPLPGTADYLYWLRIANRLKRNLYQNVTKQWSSTYQVIELGTISPSLEPSIALDDTFLSPSDSCYVLDTAGQRHDFVIIEPQNKNPLRQEVFIAGQDPKTLYFTKPITAADGYASGRLYLPGYVMPDDFTAPTATVNVDDPDWLVVATAAKVAFGDITYEDKVADLNAEADFLYKQMVANNRRGTAGNPRTLRYNMHRIGTRHGRG